jgi:hypothetical protein
MEDDGIIEMPSEAELRRLFSLYGLDYFMEKTGIIDDLQGRKVAAGIELACQIALATFVECAESMPLPMRTAVVVQAHMALEAIIAKLIENHPQVKADLAEFKNALAPKK